MSERTLSTTSIQVHVILLLAMFVCVTSLHFFVLINVGSVIGFTNLGEINDHLLAYEKLVDSSRGNEAEEHEDVAKSMLVLMVRGLFTRLKFAYAQFPCSSVCGYQLYDIFWEAVQRLERCGFTVLACTCDGLSANRTFIGLHGTTNGVSKTLNPYAEEERYVYFFLDPPHLMKTTRNCWASDKRLLWV